MPHLKHKAKRLGTNWHTDRRANERARSTFRLVQIEHSGDAGLARCRNISDGGAALHLTMPVKLNDELSIAFSPTAILAAQVVWVDGEECGVKFRHAIDSDDLLCTSSAETHGTNASAPRLTANLPARVAVDSLVSETTVHNISQGEIELEDRGGFRPGLRVKIMLDAGIEREGIVRWAGHNIARLNLIRPLSVDELGSVQRLKSGA